MDKRPMFASKEGISEEETRKIERKIQLKAEKRKVYNTIIIAVKREMQKENIAIDDEKAIEKIIRNIFENYQNIFENVARARGDILDEELIDYNGMIQEIVEFVVTDGRLKIVKDDGEERN